jgi:outer membrane protein OmpA-like peptidoglycan-associated protein
MKHRFIALLFVVTLTLSIALGAYAQSDKDNGSSAGSTSGATSNSNVSITNNSTSKPQFMGVLPGSAGVGVMPGYAGDNPACKVFSPPPERHLTMSKVRAMAKGSKLKTKNMHIAVWDSVPANDDPIDLVDYKATEFAYSNDAFLGSLVFPGKYLYPDEEILGPALLEFKRLTGTHRVMVMNCPEIDSRTRASSGGVGITYGAVPGSGSNGGSAALGYSKGSSDSTKEQKSVLVIYALNDGPPLQPGKQVKTEEPQEAAPAPSPTPPPQQSTPPPVTNNQQQAPAAAPPPPLAAAAPAPAAAPPADPCADNFPQIAIYFVFNKADVQPEYLPEVVLLEDWMVKHPTCNVVVEGYASFEGGNHYNDGLSNDRARNVYDILIKNKAIADHVKLHLAAGKYFAQKQGPNPEYTKEDRKVIFSIRNITSQQDN